MQAKEAEPLDEEENDLKQQIDYLQERVEQLEQEMLKARQKQAWHLVGM
jgi:prefoldin subunit 5